MKVFTTPNIYFTSTGTYRRDILITLDNLNSKAQLWKRSFHGPNLIRIWTDVNYETYSVRLLIQAT